MPDQPIDAAATPTRSLERGEGESHREEGESRRAERRTDGGHLKRTDWRLGGRTVLKWREWLVGGALISLGASVLIAATIALLWPSIWTAAIGAAVLWIGMLVPVVRALVRSRPAGLLRFRALDVLYGLMLGMLLRVVQGYLERASGGTAAFPSYGLVDGQLPPGWLVTDALGTVVIAPIIEEFFFRAVLLVAIYTILRRSVGKATAGGVSLLMTTGLFVLVHGLTVSLSTDAVVSLTLLGLVCGLLVLLTGRIWGAVLVHVVFNATYVVLALAGTFGM